MSKVISIHVRMCDSCPRGEFVQTAKAHIYIVTCMSSQPSRWMRPHQAFIRRKLVVHHSRLDRQTELSKPGENIKVL